MSTDHDAVEATAGPAASDVGRPVARERRWLLALGALALVAVAFAYRALLLFAPADSIVVQIEGWFFEPSDTSPVLVAALALWLLYRRKQRLEALAWEPGRAWLSLALFAASLAPFVWALRTGASDLQAISLMLAVFAAAYAFGGCAAVRVVWLPACFLLFAVPLPSPLRHAIVWKFQLWTAEATGRLLYLLGVPALVSGDRLLLSDDVFAVIETCSGLRSVITLTMLSVLMVDLFRRRSVHAALLIGIAPPLAFATNAVRCVGLVLNPKSNIATIHTMQGIAMLLASVLVLYAIDGLLARIRTPGSEGPRRLHRSQQPRRISGARAAIAGAGLALLVLLSLVVSPWRIENPATPLPTDVIAPSVGLWRSADLQTDRLFLGMTGITGVVDRRYSRGFESVDVFVASGTPRLRLRSFYSPKTGLPGSGWILEEQSRSTIAGHEASALVVRRGAERRLVYHWYQGTRGLAEETLRDALALDQSPWARPWRGSVVRLSTPLDSLSPRAVAKERLERMAHLLDTALKALSQAPGENAGGEEREFSFSPTVEKRFHSVFVAGPDNPE